MRMRQILAWQNRQLRHRIAVLCAQLVQITELKRTHVASINAHRVQPSIAKRLARIALTDDFQIGAHYRNAIGASKHARSTTDAQIIVMLNRSILSFMHRQRRTRLHTRRILAMVTRRRVMVPNRIRVFTCFERSHAAIQLPNLQIIAVLAGRLARTAPAASALVIVKSKSHFRLLWHIAAIPHRAAAQPGARRRAECPDAHTFQSEPNGCYSPAERRRLWWNQSAHSFRR